MKVNWFFKWVGGGYNNVYASSKREALKLAKQKGASVQFARHLWTKELIPDPKSLVRDPHLARTLAEDAKYAGMFD